MYKAQRLGRGVTGEAVGQPRVSEHQHPRLRFKVDDVGGGRRRVRIGFRQAGLDLPHLGIMEQHPGTARGDVQEIEPDDLSAVAVDMLFHRGVLEMLLCPALGEEGHEPGHVVALLGQDIPGGCPDISGERLHAVVGQQIAGHVDRVYLVGLAALELGLGEPGLGGGSDRVHELRLVDGVDDRREMIVRAERISRGGGVGHRRSLRRWGGYSGPANRPLVPAVGSALLWPRRRRGPD